jgi:hypothetical protein
MEELRQGIMAARIEYPTERSSELPIQEETAGDGGGDQRPRLKQAGMWRPTTASLAKAEDGASARSRVPRLHIGEAGMQATLSLCVCFHCERI